MQATPHECLEIYHQLCLQMNIMNVLRGPVRVANNLNKALYLIFGRFVSYFNHKLDEIDKVPAAEGVDSDRLKRIGGEVMKEFEAPERRMYTQWSFDVREKAIDNIVIPKSWRSALVTLMYKLTAEPELIKKMRNAVKDARLELLELCDQSLTGFQSLLYAYQWYRLGKPVPDFDISRINIKSPNEKYTVDERDELSGVVDEMKETVATKYFYHEISVRMKRKERDSLPAHIIHLLNELKKINAGNPTDRPGITKQVIVDEAFSRFINQVAVTGIIVIPEDIPAGTDPV